MDTPSTSPTPARCLTEAEIASLRSAASEAIPTARAEHIASCGRCQERLLSSELSPTKRKRAVKDRELMPPTGRLLVFAGLLVIAIALFFLTLRRLLEG
jgi:hypothetical protein